MLNRNTFIVEKLEQVSDTPEMWQMTVRWDATYDDSQLKNLYTITERLDGVQQVNEYRYAMVVEFFPHVISANDLAGNIENLILMLKFQADVAIFLPKE